MKKIKEALKKVDESLSDYDKEEIRNGLEELINEYKVPVDQAVSSIIRKYEDRSQNKAGKQKINKIEPDETGIDLVARVIRKNKRKIEVEGEEREVISGTLGDETGVINFTAWKDLPYEEGEVIQIRNSYTREWQNRPELQIGDYTDIEEANEELVPSLSELKSPQKVTIKEVEDVYVAEVEATLIDVLDRSGLVMRCPQCNRVTKGGECQEHGEVEAEADLRIKGVLDDGEGTIQATFPKEVTEEITGITLEEAKEMARDALDRSVVQEKMKDIIGKTIIVQGRAIGNNFVVNEVRETQWDPEQKAKKLLNEINEMEAM